MLDWFFSLLSAIICKVSVFRQGNPTDDNVQQVIMMITQMKQISANLEKIDMLYDKSTDKELIEILPIEFELCAIQEHWGSVEEIITVTI